MTFFISPSLGEGLRVVSSTSLRVKILPLMTDVLRLCPRFPFSSRGEDGEEDKDNKVTASSMLIFPPLTSAIVIFDAFSPSDAVESLSSSSLKCEVLLNSRTCEMGN